MFLLPLVSVEKQKGDKKKNPSLKPYIEVINQYPYVPLIADINLSKLYFDKTMNIYDYLLKEDPNFADLAIDVQPKIYNCSRQMDDIKKKHHDFISKYSVQINGLKTVLNAKKVVSQELGMAVINLVLCGVKLISECTKAIYMQAAYKYLVPTTKPEYKEALAYQKVLRYNYDAEDYISIIELVSIIKSLSNTLLRDESLLFPVIRGAIHYDVQYFIQEQIAGIIVALDKKASNKKSWLKPKLLLIRNICGDWLGGVEPSEEELCKEYKKDAKKGKSSGARFPSRNVAPSSAQIVLLKILLYDVACCKKELSSDFSKKLDAFVNRLDYYPELLELNKTISTCSDLGNLWYREYYLDMETQPQFSVNDSFPSILLSQLFDAMNNRVQELTEYILYPFDIYNDAANMALHRFKKQHLFNEIEAEMNLCFDQFLFQLSIHLVRYFVARATSIYIDQHYKTLLEAGSGPSLEPPIARFDVIMEQRTFQLLGRVINLNSVLCQRVINQLKERIEYAIASFEASDLRGVVDLDAQLTILRIAHGLLSKCFELEPFDSILSEKNNSVSLVGYQSRILGHVLSELADDIAPNFMLNTFTGRFIRKATCTKQKRPPMPKTVVPYGTKELTEFMLKRFACYGESFGLTQLISLLRVVKASEAPVLITAIQEHLNIKIDELQQIVEQVNAGLKSSKISHHTLKFSGSFEATKTVYNTLLKYEELPHMLDILSYIGNIIAFIYLLDKVQAEQTLEIFPTTAPFLGIADNESLRDSLESRKRSCYTTVAETMKFLIGNEEYQKLPVFYREVAVYVKTAEDFYGGANGRFSIFKMLLLYLKNSIVASSEKYGGKTIQDALVHPDGTKMFYQAWSFAEFVSCLYDTNYRRNHGDGLAWAGTTLTTLLGQYPVYLSASINSVAIGLAEHPDTTLAPESGKSEKSKEVSDAEKEEVFLRNVVSLRQVITSVHHIISGFSNLVSQQVQTINPPSVIDSDSL